MKTLHCMEGLRCAAPGPAARPSRRSHNGFRALAALGLLLLGACSSVTAERMVPDNLQLVNRTSADVEVQVLGGVDTTIMAAYMEIDVDEFEDAIKMAIREQQLFGSVGDADSAYHLEVTVYEISGLPAETMVGIHYKVEANWKLTNAKGQVLFQERIDTDHEATFSDAFAGGNRMVCATEGAGMKNIQAGLEAISALNLEP